MKNKKAEVSKFFLKNKKGELDSLIKIILWIVFFGIALLALYFLVKRIGAV